MTEKTYNVGIYCRLSNDDERDGESVSIENQKLLLQSYVRQMGWNEIDVYIDDGYTGTNFNRPGVQRLIEDAKAKRINLILVKDLSRFGRNYIEIGQYTDYLFPSIGCRFVALNNGVDTESKNGSTDVMCFLNLFNEFYSRDTSKKVKAVKRACAENGKFMGTYPAYGYKRDPEDKHHLVIDEDTAPIVRRIFSMRATGMGFTGIAAQLNEEGIPSPGMLYYQRRGKADPRRVNHKWAGETVKHLIRNEVYIGNMVQGKTGTVSYKNKKLISKPEDEWIRVEGTHEPIISQEIWDTVQSIDQKRVRKNAASDGIRSVFTGLVYCAECGFKMRNHTEKFTYKDGSPGRYSSFICGNYARSGKSACTIHTIYENVLEQIVLEDIREKARFAAHDPEMLAQHILRLKDKEAQSHRTSCEQELKAVKTRLDELERLMQSLYEDKYSGTVPQSVFQTLMRKYETERAEKAAALPELELKLKAHMENRQDAGRWTEIIRQYTEITKLDESMLFALVDRIEVGEAQKVRGVRVRDVKVYYRYVGNVDDAIAEERREQYEQAV
jgi:site-specific DNA recombinase